MWSQVGILNQRYYWVEIFWFSNSLIIHEDKTKEITSVKEVWICDPNYHKIRRSFALIFSKNCQCFEKLYQTLESVFHQISKHFEVGLKKPGWASFFQPTSQCFDIWWNTLPRVWCITSLICFNKIFLGSCSFPNINKQKPVAIRFVLNSSVI